MAHEREFRSMEMQTKNREIDAREDELKSNAMLVAANVKKIDEEAYLVRINRKAALLLKRKELQDAGIHVEDIDKVLPITYD